MTAVGIAAPADELEELAPVLLAPEPEPAEPVEPPRVLELPEPEVLVADVLFEPDVAVELLPAREVALLAIALKDELADAMRELAAEVREPRELAAELSAGPSVVEGLK